MEATSSGSMKIPTSAFKENCKRQKELRKFQNKVKTINDLINSHEVTSFGEEASNASREWNKKFKEGKKGAKDDGNEKGLTEWEKIQTFLVIPLFFEMKELQLLVEDELRDDLGKKEKNFVNFSICFIMISFQRSDSIFL